MTTQFILFVQEDELREMEESDSIGAYSWDYALCRNRDKSPATFDSEEVRNGVVIRRYWVKSGFRRLDVLKVYRQMRRCQPTARYGFKEVE